MKDDLTKACIEGVKAALQVFTGSKSPPAAAQDLIKALEASEKATKTRPR